MDFQELVVTVLKHVQERADRDSTGSLVSLLGRGSSVALTLDRLKDAYPSSLNDCLLAYVAVTHDVFMYAMNPWLFGREFAKQWSIMPAAGAGAGAGEGTATDFDADALSGLGPHDSSALRKLSTGDFDLERAVKQMERWRNAVCALYGLKRAVVVDGVPTVQTPPKTEEFLQSLLAGGCRSDAAIMDVLCSNAETCRALVRKSCAISCSLYFVARVPSVSAANPALRQVFGMGCSYPASTCPHVAMMFEHVSVPISPL